MSENRENADFVESIEDPAVGEPFSDAEIQDFIDRGGEAPSFHPILRVWREVLKPAREELGARITPQYASRIIASYSGFGFADMPDFRDRYFGKILELEQILDYEIDTDDECLSYTTPAEDAEHNSHHYKNLLTTWQCAFLQWELDWECTDPAAAVEMAAISEVYKMFFGQNGLTAFLDNIGFEYDEADQAELSAVLEGMKEGR